MPEFGKVGEVFDIDHDLYEVIDPPFRNRKDPPDYLQLMRKRDCTLFMLKMNSKQRLSSTSVDILKLQQLGTQIANCCGLRSQRSKVVGEFKEFSLLVEDIRGDIEVCAMDPICYAVEPSFFKKKTLVYFLDNYLSNNPLSISRFVKKKNFNWDIPYYKVLILDILISNSMRSTRSIRLLTKVDSKKKTHCILIENIFGSSHLVDNNPFKDQDLDEIFEAIKYLKDEQAAKEFIRNILLRKNELYKILEDATYLTIKEYQVCFEVLRTSLIRLETMVLIIEKKLTAKRKRWAFLNW